MKPSAPPVPVILDDNDIAALHALADGERQRWERAASIALNLMEAAHAEGVTIRKGDVYAAVAREIEAASGTVAEWCKVYEAVGAETINDYGFFGFAHWRQIRALAKRNGRDIREEAEAWAVSADDYAGRPVPVDVLGAALAGEKDAGVVSPLARSLGRLERAVASHAGIVARGMDAGIRPGQRAAWETVEAAVRDYCAAFGEGAGL